MKRFIQYLSVLLLLYILSSCMKVGGCHGGGGYSHNQASQQNICSLSIS